MGPYLSWRPTCSRTVYRNETDNLRLDASRTNVWTYVADEDHNGVTYPGSSALDWVRSRIAALGLP